VSSSNSAEDILTTQFATELEILHRVASVEERYGAAYVHYTRYRLLKKIADTVGLHIHKPSRKVTLGASDFTYDDLFHWAGVNPDSFGNVKALIATAEHIRQGFDQSPALKQQYTTFSAELDSLAQNPASARTRPASLSWTITDLRRRVNQCQRKCVFPACIVHFLTICSVNAAVNM
jgi:hypothetical protein